MKTTAREANISPRELFAFQFSEGAAIVVLAGHGAIQRNGFCKKKNFCPDVLLLMLLKTIIHFQDCFFFF